MPRYKVLSAGKVMRAAGPRASELHGQGVAVAAKSKLDDLIDRATETDDPLPVADETGALIGEIDRSIIMRAMSSRG